MYRFFFRCCIQALLLSFCLKIFICMVYCARLFFFYIFLAEPLSFLMFWIPYPLFSYISRMKWLKFFRNVMLLECASQSEKHSIKLPNMRNNKRLSYRPYLRVQFDSSNVFDRRWMCGLRKLIAIIKIVQQNLSKLV